MPSIIEVTLTGLYFGVETNNTWTYQSDSEVDFTSESQWLLDEMGFVTVTAGAFDTGTIARAIQSYAAAAFAFSSVFARDIYSNFDFYEIVYSPEPVGLAGGDALSPAMAAGMRTNRSRTDVRRGQKRFVGLTETGVGPGGVLTGTQLAAAEALANAMEVDLVHTEGGITTTFSPVVCGKQRYNPDTGLPSDTGRAYRFYPTYDEQADHVANIGQWSVYPQARTQTSRQYGRGR